MTQDIAKIRKGLSRAQWDALHTVKVGGVPLYRLTPKQALYWAKGHGAGWLENVCVGLDCRSAIGGQVVPLGRTVAGEDRK